MDDTEPISQDPSTLGASINEVDAAIAQLVDWDQVPAENRVEIRRILGLDGGPGRARHLRVIGDDDEV